MLNVDPFINAFSRLGEFLRQFPEHQKNNAPELAHLNISLYDSFQSVLHREYVNNPWFTPDWVNRALFGIARMLDEEVLRKWLGPYRLSTRKDETVKTVGLVLAGNIPMVGFHDILCVLASGHRILAKPSSRDDRLIRKTAEAISLIDPSLGGRITFSGDTLSGLDAVIATGSNNSARYFEYYFRDIPHVIRKNRSGVAVITGDESEEELAGIGEDIFTYFGLGCRNVTKLYVPESYDLKILMSAMDGFSHLREYHKYMNNVEYYRTIYLMNRQDFLDNGVLLLKEDRAIASPVGVVFYERYSEIGTVKQQLKVRDEEIQCVVSISPGISKAIKPGTSQQPMPWDYADGVDTLRFLKELN
ncbi:MAG: acyl-CoA reductase [Bacteroidota bacterium]